MDSLKQVKSRQDVYPISKSYPHSPLKQVRKSNSPNKIKIENQSFKGMSQKSLKSITFLNKSSSKSSCTQSDRMDVKINMKQKTPNITSENFEIENVDDKTSPNQRKGSNLITNLNFSYIKRPLLQFKIGSVRTSFLHQSTNMKEKNNRLSQLIIEDFQNYERDAPFKFTTPNIGTNTNADETEVNTQGQHSPAKRLESSPQKSSDGFHKRTYLASYLNMLKNDNNNFPNDLNLAQNQPFDKSVKTNNRVSQKNISSFNSRLRKVRGKRSETVKLKQRAMKDSIIKKIVEYENLRKQNIKWNILPQSNSLHKTSCMVYERMNNRNMYAHMYHHREMNDSMELDATNKSIAMPNLKTPISNKNKQNDSTQKSNNDMNLDFGKANERVNLNEKSVPHSKQTSKNLATKWNRNIAFNTKLPSPKAGSKIPDIQSITGMKVSDMLRNTHTKSFMKRRKPKNHTNRYSFSKNYNSSKSPKRSIHASEHPTDSSSIKNYEN